MHFDADAVVRASLAALLAVLLIATRTQRDDDGIAAHAERFSARHARIVTGAFAWAEVAYRATVAFCW
jgi:hypothetical protein